MHRPRKQSNIPLHSEQSNGFGRGTRVENEAALEEFPNDIQLKVDAIGEHNKHKRKTQKPQNGQDIPLRFRVDFARLVFRFSYKPRRLS
jgi:hypothetical protein